MEYYLLRIPAYLSISLCGSVGIYFLFIHFYKINSSQFFSKLLIQFSLFSVLSQSLITIYYSQISPVGSMAVFYSIVNLFILIFLYIYRSDLSLKFYLYWSFALLFLMGMEIRAIQTLYLGFN